MHPASRCEPVRSIEAAIARVAGSGLRLSWTVTGDIDRLRLPPAAPPVRADGLWQHSCFEVFLRADDKDAYVEWNLAPSGAWACYRFERRRAGLRFERVLGAQLSGIDLKKRNDILALLAIEFQETDAPAGFVTLRFSGGAAIRLNVECIEVELKDLGAAWSTRRMPRHADSDSSEGS